MYKKHERDNYKATITKEGLTLRLLQDDFEAIFVNNMHYSVVDTISYIEYLGETNWKIKDDGFVCKATNYQPALTEITKIEMWR